MSSKTGKKISKGSTSVVGSKNRISAPAASKSRSGSNRVTERLMEEANELMQRLETANILSQDQIESLVHRLLDRYKQISIMNKVDSKREEMLQAEIEDIHRKNKEAHDESKSIRDEYNTKETKIAKLDKLSKQLSGRLRSIESKASDDVKDEKENRLKMSYEFSSTIKDISQKLDQLSKKREQILAENSRLKQVLRDCLEEFDRDQELQKLQGDNATEPIDPLELFQAEPKEPKSAEERSESERKEMEVEDDISRIITLRAKEDVLKGHTVKFMEIFDTFQSRLTKSNEMFQAKQASVEEMTKRIKNLEKSNQKLTSRVTECSNSTNVIVDNIDKLRTEKSKYEKMIEKQKNLMEKFKADITAMEKY